MSDSTSKMKIENPNYSEKDLQFIETALIKAKIIKSHQDLVASGLRLFVEEQNATQFFVHIGSADPYKGGSGSTYSVGKAGGVVKLQSTETYAPAPEPTPKK